jgi:hypothetical protein
MTAHITRPEDSYAQSYIDHKTYILKWRKNNKEKLKQYNREYQRRLRQDPTKYLELTMRINTRAYLFGKWKTCYKVVSAIGMTREQLASKHNMTEEQLIELLKTHEIDHIISASWFNNDVNKHLKPYMYRHYNIQFIPRGTNRKKHKYVDENDIRVQLVKTLLEMDYYHSQNIYDSEIMKKITSLARKANTLKNRIKKMYK